MFLQWGHVLFFTQRYIPKIAFLFWSNFQQHLDDFTPQKWFIFGCVHFVKAKTGLFNIRSRRLIILVNSSQKNTDNGYKPQEKFKWISLQCGVFSIAALLRTTTFDKWFCLSCLWYSVFCSFNCMAYCDINGQSSCYSIHDLPEPFFFPFAFPIATSASNFGRERSFVKFCEFTEWSLISLSSVTALEHDRSASWKIHQPSTNFRFYLKTLKIVFFSKLKCLVTAGLYW